MRSLAHAAVTVALLACGLFVYDVLRSDPPVDLAWDASSEQATAAARREPGSGPPDTPGGALPAEIPAAAADLMDRLSRLEEAARDLPQPLGAGLAGRSSPAGTPGEGTGGSADAGVPLDTDRVKAFRQAMEAVERVQREEQLSTSIRAQLAPLNLSLAPRQEQLVVEATTRLWHAQAELWRSLGTQAADESRRQQAQAELATLREAWATGIRGDLSASDAEKVIAHFSRGVSGIGPGTRFGPDFVGPPGGPPGLPR